MTFVSSTRCRGVPGGGRTGSPRGRGSRRVRRGSRARVRTRDSLVGDAVLLVELVVLLIRGVRALRLGEARDAAHQTRRASAVRGRARADEIHGGATPRERPRCDRVRTQARSRSRHRTPDRDTVPRAPRNAAPHPTRRPPFHARPPAVCQSCSGTDGGNRPTRGLFVSPSLGRWNSMPRPMSARRADFLHPEKESYGQTVMKENDIGGRENICTKSCRRDGSGSRGWRVDEAYSIRAGPLPRRRTNASSVDTPDSRDDLESRRSRHETRRFAPRRSLDDARDQITGPLGTREDEP